MATASWAIPGRLAAEFGDGGSVLARYATRLDAVEVNSSFYKDHQPKTYARWAGTVPDGFRFAIKMPRRITHSLQLVGVDAALDTFFGTIVALGDKLGPVLVQLPPSLAFEAAVAERFATALRRRFDGDLALEPRHASWFTGEADRMLDDRRIARVAADPPPAPSGGDPAGHSGLVYVRLHGAPRTYYSDYDASRLGAWARRLIACGAHGVWCVFDNTALGAATANALSCVAMLRAEAHPECR